MDWLNELMATESPWFVLVIFLARITDVSLGTVRLICVTRGQRVAAMLLGFAETCIWVFAISSVFARLDRFENILAYAGGFATGNGVGMWIESRLGLGVQTLSFITTGASGRLVERLQHAGFSATVLSGSALTGPVSVCLVVVRRREVPLAVRVAREVDPGVVVTVEDVRETTATGPRPPGAGKIPLLPPPGAWLRRQAARRRSGRKPSRPAA